MTQPRPTSERVTEVHHREQATTYRDGPPELLKLNPTNSD
jgi:hypothetical protein